MKRLINFINDWWYIPFLITIISLVLYGIGWFAVELYKRDIEKRNSYIIRYDIDTIEEHNGLCKYYVYAKWSYPHTIVGRQYMVDSCSKYTLVDTISVEQFNNSLRHE